MKDGKIESGFYLIICLIFLLPLALSRCSNKPSDSATLVLLNGNVITLEDDIPKAEAVAVTGDTILAVGSNTKILQFKTEKTKVIDLAGKTVVPGLIDAHLHFPLLGKRLKLVYLDETRSYQEVLKIVKQAVERAEPGEWIMGSGWHTANWTDKTYPDNRELNIIAPENPVYLSGMAIHAALVNSQILEKAGINRHTPDPKGGRIVKDPESGEPTGLLLEKAQSLAQKCFPPETDKIKKENILLSMRVAHELGLTGVHDAGVDADTIRLYKELLEEDRLDLRLYVMFLVPGDGEVLEQFILKSPEIGLADNRLTIRCIKVFVDGALGARGAVMIDPYSDRPEETGIPVNSQQGIYQVVLKSMQAGYQVAMHTIGDGANLIGLDAVEKALQSVSPENPRIRIEHAQILRPLDIPRFASLGVIPSMQPIHCLMDMGFAEARIGKERMKSAYAWKSLTDSGARIAAGSDVPDFPVKYTNPLRGIHAAVTRRDLEGNPEGGWYPKEKVSRMEAIKMYTLNAAYAAFEEDIKGSLRIGKLADMTVLSKDVLAVPEEEIPEIEILMTILGGRIVFTKD